MNNHKGLKTWILIGFCFAAQIVVGSNYNPPMKATDGSTISNLTILDFVENGENVKVGEEFTSTRSGQTVKVYVKWAQYVYTYRTLLDEAKKLNPSRYSKYATLEKFIASWVEISGEKAGSENRFKNTGVYITTGVIEPLPSFTTWMSLPTNTSYWGIVDGEIYDIWAKGNCANVILTYMEYIAPVVEDRPEPAPQKVVTRRTMGPNERVTCLGDTVTLGIRTQTGTYAKGNSLWLSDAGVWYKLNPKTELCPTESKSTTTTVTNNYYTNNCCEEKKKIVCDCDGIHHTYINDVCCCGQRKMSQSYCGDHHNTVVTNRSRSSFGNFWLRFDSGNPVYQIGQQVTPTIFGGSPSTGGSNGYWGGGPSSGGSTGGGSSTGGNGAGTGGNVSTGGGTISGVNQPMPRQR
jgi:uncharacterized membrane protein YgcG